MRRQQAHQLGRAGKLARPAHDARRVPLPLVASPLSISPPKRTYIGPGNVGPLPPLEWWVQLRAAACYGSCRRGVVRVVVQC